MGSAQLDILPDEGEANAGPAQPSALQRQVAERLASHRERRRREGRAEPDVRSDSPAVPKHRVAAAVRERYAQTPSYRAVLAEQAKRAIHEAAAAAEVAVRNAEAVAVAQQQLLGELELWTAPQEFSAETAQTIVPAAAEAVAEPVAIAPPSAAFDAVPARPNPAPLASPRAAGLTVRLYQDLSHIPPAAAAPAHRTPGTARHAHTFNPAARMSPHDAAEALALDAEIAFRQAPVFEEEWVDLEPSVPLPANLLEFPRQLVAARKARPRLAEGPLRDEAAPRNRQLRIFEVEATQISSAPAALPAAPEWSSIRLDAHKVTAPEASPEATAMPVLASLLPPQTAPLHQRLMATLVDVILVGFGLLTFVAVFLKVAGTVPLGLPTALAACALWATFYIMYHMLFFTLNEHTPGMRYARIGLCTFTDENPSRKAMRKRILGQIVAVCPLGLGLLWVLLDDDSLGWHDRISRMYQRAY